MQLQDPTIIPETGQVITYGIDELTGELDIQVKDIANLKTTPKTPIEKWKPVP